MKFVEICTSKWNETETEQEGDGNILREDAFDGSGWDDAIAPAQQQNTQKCRQNQQQPTIQLGHANEQHW